LLIFALYFLYLISHSWKLIVDWLLLKIGEYYFGQDRIGELTSGQEGHADNGNHIVESPGSANMTNQIHNEFMVLLACIFLYAMSSYYLFLS
jgi:hypothetical protein